MLSLSFEYLNLVRKEYNGRAHACHAHSTTARSPPSSNAGIHVPAHHERESARMGRCHPKCAAGKDPFACTSRENDAVPPIFIAF
eukprot:2806783-Amphidinium_carterae.1